MTTQHIVRDPATTTSAPVHSLRAGDQPDRVHEGVRMGGPMQTFRVVLVHDSGHRETYRAGLPLSAASALADDLERTITTTSVDVRVEEE